MSDQPFQTFLTSGGLNSIEYKVYTYLGYIKYPTYPVQCSKTAVFSGLEWNIWFEKSNFIFLKKTCEMTAVTLVTICTYVVKHIEFADFTTIFCSVLVTLRWSFDVRFFALELLHAEKLSATIFLCGDWEWRRWRFSSRQCVAMEQRYALTCCATVLMRVMQQPWVNRVHRRRSVF